MAKPVVGRYFRDKNPASPPAAWPRVESLREIEVKSLGQLAYEQFNCAYCDADPWDESPEDNKLYWQQAAEGFLEKVARQRAMDQIAQGKG